MNIQIINFENNSAAEYYSGKFGINPPENRKGFFGLYVSESDISFFSPLIREFIFQNEDDFIVFGKIDDIEECIFSMASEYPEVSRYAEAVLSNYINYDNYIFEIKGKKFSTFSPLVMGILNVTPDSFSDGGEFFDREKALEHAIEMINCGADIIDVGGESSRPGAKPVSAEEELDRVIPVIRKIARMEKNILISIDTTKAIVAEEALKAGADIVNDISSFGFDEAILEVVRRYDAPYVLMHIKGTPETMQRRPFYNEPVAEIHQFLADNIAHLNSIGINNIIIDPGIGFGKRVRDNYDIISRLEEFKSFGLPILTGVSRKSFLGNSLSLDVDKRGNATTVAETVSVMNGASIIRTHDVSAAFEMKRIIEFVKEPGLSE